MNKLRRKRPWVTPRQRRTLSTKEVIAIARETLRELDERALKGDTCAAESILHLAFSCVESVDALIRIEGSHLSETLKSSVIWPVVFPAKRKDQEALAKTLRDRGLSRNIELNTLGKWSKDSRATSCVLDIYHLVTSRRNDPRTGNLMIFNGRAVTPEQSALWKEWLNKHLSELPERLSKENSAQWAKLTQPVLEIFWRKELELDPDFKDYAKGELEDSKRRGEILRIWRQSWKSIARSDVSFGTNA